MSLRQRSADFHLFPAGPLVQDDPTERPLLRPPAGGSVPLSVNDANVLNIDPRLRLALDIAPTLRLGQVGRLMRSQLDLAYEIVDPKSGAVTIGGFAHVPGRGKKQSPGRVLRKDALAAMNAAISVGYPAPLEAQHESGAVADYPIFPGGRLVAGMVNPSNPDARHPADRGALSAWFKQLEAAAGVQSKKGRGWNALRRLIADETPQHTSNPVVQSRVSGTSEQTLRGVYRDKVSLREALEASDVAAAMRASGRTSRNGVAPTPSATALDPEIVSLIDGYSAEEVRAALRHIRRPRAG